MEILSYTSLLLTNCPWLYPQFIFLSIADVQVSFFFSRTHHLSALWLCSVRNVLGYLSPPLSFSLSFIFPFASSLQFWLGFWLLETRIHEDSPRKGKTVHNNTKVEKAEVLWARTTDFRGRRPWMFDVSPLAFFAHSSWASPASCFFSSFYQLACSLSTVCFLVLNAYSVFSLEQWLTFMNWFVLWSHR